MRQFDRKHRGFYDELTDEERKKFSNYLMIRWGSSVQGSSDLQSFYVISTNQRLNRHFFAINRHPKLQWLCATTVSPDMGCHEHPWISPKKKDAGTSESRKALMALYPNMKMSDIDLMSRINDVKTIRSCLREHGKND